VKRLITFLLIVAFVHSVSFGQKKKKYQPPAVTTPVNLDRDLANAQPDPQSLGDINWFKVFQDDKLQGLIREAFTANYDARAAVTRIEQARANLGITRSDQFPTIGATGGGTFGGLLGGSSSSTTAQSTDTVSRSFGGVLLNLFTFELDIWGRKRKATEAARADLAATEEERRTVLTTIVADVATSYYNLRELDYELEIAKQTLKSRQDSLKIIGLRQARGVSNLLEVRQAEELVYDATETIPAVEKSIEQQENFLCVLVGRNPGTIERGQGLTEQPAAPEVPPGLPSELLLRRPDIRSAEQQLFAADARVDVARKAFFPTISLSGVLGFESGKFSNLFSYTGGVWGFVPQFSQPIFDGGRLKSNLKLTKAQEDYLVVNYEKTIQTAFQDVANSLIAYRKVREVRGQRELLVKTLQDRSRLAYLRYKEGVSNLLEALDADRELFNAELSLAQARRDELLTVVQLYKALGGGWQ
jgi:multidrug efflux system outer membrane protein